MSLADTAVSGTSALHVNPFYVLGATTHDKRQRIIELEEVGSLVADETEGLTHEPQAAGAAVMSLPSNETYAAMQTGAVDAVVTSSTSMISFRLEELSKHLTTSCHTSFLFAFEPLLMWVAVRLPSPDQKPYLSGSAGRCSHGRV